MTTDDILRMAREAGLLIPTYRDHITHLERFAAMVAAAEREACAKVCEYRAMALDNGGNAYLRDHAALDCARSIRARGKQ